MKTPTAGSRWLRLDDNRIIVVIRVSDLNMNVWWHYEDEVVHHCSDLYDFVAWNEFKPL